MNVAHLTALLHTSKEPLWQRLREIVREKGHEVESTAVVESFEDGTNIEFGVLVTSDRRVYQFRLDYDNTSVDKARVVEWKNVTSRWQRSSLKQEIGRAMRLLGGGAASSRAFAVDLPSGTEIRLEMPQRGGHVSLWWTDCGKENRRVSFWFEGRRMAISCRFVRSCNDHRSSSDDQDLPDMPAGPLLDHLPTPPIRLRPKPKHTGLARLSEVFDPAAHQTDQWVLATGESAKGAIYNSYVVASVKIRLEFDLGAMVVWYSEEDFFCDS